MPVLTALVAVALVNAIVSGVVVFLIAAFCPCCCGCACCWMLLVLLSLLYFVLALAVDYSEHIKYVN